MRRSKIKLLAVVLTIVLSVVGCSNTSKEKETTDEMENNIQKSNYIHLTMLFPKTINPILNKDKSVAYIMNLIYEGLFGIDENYNVENKLVEKYTMSSDGKSIEIKLVSDAKWHDGSDVTSSDVKFTIDLIQKNSDSPYSDLVSNIKNINIQDSENFTILLNESDPFILEKLTFPIVSSDELSNVSTKDLAENKYNYIGNGAYKIKEYVERQHLILEKNEDYFGDLLENRKEIFIKLVPDKESQTEMVLSLDSDIASISLGELSKFENKKEFNITDYAGRDYEMAIFNYDNEYLNNKNFRKAIISAIDREKIIKEAYVGYATLSNFPLRTTSKYYNEDIKAIEYNKENALKYLSKGLKTVSESIESKKEDEEKTDDLNGIVEDNTGSAKSNSELSKDEIKEILKEINLKIIVSADNDERLKVANIISSNLSSIGIKTTVEELDDKAMSKALSDKEYDIALIGYSLSSIPDVRGIIESCNINDKQLSSYISALGNSTSEDETKKVYNQIQKYMVDNASFISLGVLDNFIVTNKRLEGAIYPNDFDTYKGISNLQMSK